MSHDKSQVCRQMTAMFADKACAVTCTVHGKHIYCWSNNSKANLLCH